MEDLERLERAGWDALCAGTGSEFYGTLMTADGVMVLAHGLVLDRDDVVASLGEAPPWASYSLSELGVWCRSATTRRRWSIEPTRPGRARSSLH